MKMRQLLGLLRSNPQSEPMHAVTTPQVPNQAGGWVWTVDPWDRLDRFLILGTDGGSYYASERDLTVRHARHVIALIREDGVRVVRRIVEISTSGRAPKNGPAIFALALAMKSGDLDTRRAAHEAVPAVCRIATHLFELAAAVKSLGGWGRGTRRAFARWYTDRSPEEAAFQVMKYGQRHGWSHRDVLRLVHAKPPTVGHDHVFQYATQGWSTDISCSPTLERIAASRRLTRTQSVRKAVKLITEYDLPREAIPSSWLQRREVWEAMLCGKKGMPMTALLRNIATMTRLGVLAPQGASTRLVVEQLSSARRLRAARVHPLQILVALQTYASGKGVRSTATWRPVPAIVDALDQAFYAAFENVPSTGLRWMIALDVSGSMGFASIAGLPGITPRVGSAAMAMATLRTEQDPITVGFSSRLKTLALSKRQRLDDVLQQVDRMPMGTTDCAQPMLYAAKHRIRTDVFVVYTDSETWSGSVHPAAALRAYRQKMGIAAKLIVVGMLSNEFTIADPDDAGMLDVVGFDTATPRLMADFATR